MRRPASGLTVLIVGVVVTVGVAGYVLEGIKARRVPTWAELRIAVVLGAFGLFCLYTVID